MKHAKKKNWRNNPNTDNSLWGTALCSPNLSEFSESHVDQTIGLHILHKWKMPTNTFVLRNTSPSRFAVPGGLCLRYFQDFGFNISSKRFIKNPFFKINISKTKDAVHGSKNVIDMPK